MHTDGISPDQLLISAIIQSGDFTVPREAGIAEEHLREHRAVWRWLERFVNKHRKVPDKPTFRHRWPDFPLLVSRDVAYATEQVLDAYLNRELSRSTREVTGLLSSGRTRDAFEANRRNVTNLTRSYAAGDAGNILEDPGDVFAEAARRSERANSHGLSGVDTGFPSVNERTGGFQPGDLGIVAARLGTGKTMSLVRMATEAVCAGLRVVFVTLEQTKAQIAFRFHTMLGRRFGYSIRNRQLMSGQGLDLTAFKGLLADLPDKVSGELRILDPSRGKIGPSTLAGMIDRLGPDVVFVDYLTLMDKVSNDWQGIAQLSADTKEVALNAGIPVVCAAQINRMGVGGKKPPTVETLAQGDSIGQEADTVITMRKYGERARQLLLAKNRSGQDDVVFYTSFDPDFGVMDEISYERAVELQAESAMEED